MEVLSSSQKNSNLGESSTTNTSTSKQQQQNQQEKKQPIQEQIQLQQNKIDVENKENHFQNSNLIQQQNKAQHQNNQQQQQQQQQKQEEQEVGETLATETVNIQECFKKFRKQRHEQFKHQQYLKNKKMQVDRTDPAFKQQLRNKFLETAKKYFGVPYAKRFHKPGDKLYDAPIFLDCCALIRQIIYDLREDFGFTLGRWNQAYQIDTLPIDLKFEELKPGDLIFYSATYYDSKKKAHPHDMVHVEIFTGGPTGEQSIGARWFNGVVQYFDSYKFKSTNYYDIKFHYRSIDTWLEGTCKSICDKHPWRDDRELWLPDKFSIFAEEFSDNEEEKEEQKVSSTNDNQTQLNDNNNQQLIPQNVFVGKGNNDQLIRNYFSKNPDKWTIMKASQNFSTKFYFKWVQTTGEIDFFSFKEGQQIINHISNINVLTNKKGMIQTIRDFEQQITTQNQYSIKSSDFLPVTYRLDIMSDEIQFLNEKSEGIWILKSNSGNQGKGVQIIAEIEQFKKDFIQSKKFYLGEYASRYYIKNFLESSAKEEKSKQLESNEIKNNGTNNAEKQQQTQVQEEEKLQEDKQLQIQQNQQHILNENTELQQQKEDANDTIRKYKDINTQSIIQKYIENPLLLENKKFDIRCYMVIACTKPLFVLFHHGYIRKSVNEYNLSNVEDNKNRFTHLTNASVQKSHPNFYKEKEDSIWTMSKFDEYLVQSQTVKNQNQITEMYDRIKMILTYMILSAQTKIERKVGTYELIGCDILLTNTLQPYLLELNTNPALFLDTKAQAEVLPIVMNRTLDLVLEINKNPSDIQNKLNIEDPFKAKKAGFDILFNEQTGFSKISNNTQN